MVVIESIRVEGFRHLNLHEPLKLDKGLIIIRGPNEAGKSTLIEAILFGLYGDVNLLTRFRRPVSETGRVTLNDVVAHGARRAIIEVTFRIGDKRYKVYRVIERRGSSVGQIDARLVDLTSNKVLAIGVRSVAREVEKLLGVSWKEMLATNVVAQKDLEHLIRLSSGDREAIINMMMGLESFNKAKEKAIEERREINRQLEEAERELEDKQRLLSYLEDLRKQYEQHIREKEKIEAELPQKEEELGKIHEIIKHLEEYREYLENKQKLEKELNRCYEELEKLDKERQDKLKRLEELKDKLSSYEDGRKRAEEKLKSKESELKAKKGIWNRLKEVRSKLEGFLADYEAKQARLRDRQEDLRKLADELGMAYGMPVAVWRKEYEEKLRALRLSLKQLIAPIILMFSSILLFFMIGSPALVLSGVGIVWMAVLAYKYHAKKLRIITIITKLESAESWESEVKRLRAEIKSLENRARDVLSAVPNEYEQLLVGSLKEIYDHLFKVIEENEHEVMRLNEHVNKLKSEIEGLEKVAEEVTEQINRLDSDIGRIGREIENKKNEAKRIKEQLESLKEPESIPGMILPRDLKDVDTWLKKYRAKEKDLAEKIGRLRATLNEHERFIKENMAKVKSLNNVRREINELKQRIEQLRHSAAVLEVIIIALSDISQKIRGGFAPKVEGHMGILINIITDGRYKAVKIDPKTYDIMVFDAQAGKFLHRNIYSGGTNDQFLFAMRIAFTLALLRGAKGTYPRFLFLDEPLGSSDPERRKRIIWLLGRKLIKHFEQILLITHVEVPEVPGATVITMENGEVQRVKKVTQAGSVEDSLIYR